MQKEGTYNAHERYLEINEANGQLFLPLFIVLVEVFVEHIASQKYLAHEEEVELIHLCLAIVVKIPEVFDVIVLIVC